MKKCVPLPFKHEMKAISSDSSNSIVQDVTEGVKQFNLFHELSLKKPLCVKVISSLVSGNNDNHKIILVCFIISILLKNWWPKKALAQQAIFILLYGNGCSKQVLSRYEVTCTCTMGIKFFVHRFLIVFSN